MPPLDSRQIGVAFDVHGCPNACRHCWLVDRSSRPITEAQVRWGVEQLRDYRRAGEAEPFFRTLTVATWFREPDFSDDYRRLHDLEVELSDGAPARYELLSVWRLARDPDYAEWARQVGPDTCQISFFGLEDNTNWFCRRRGAFRDALAATERLLEVGMKPRWQFFLTRRILPELDELMRLVDRMRLRERVEVLGGEFQFFMHPPTPDGEARKIEHLRPTIDEIRGRIPQALEEATRRHFDRDVILRTEAELVAEILDVGDKLPFAYDLPDQYWLLVKSDLDVHFNLGTLEPWWRLGNLETDGAAAIIDAVEQNRPLGLKVNFEVPARELARQFGDPASRHVYSDAGDLIERYLAEYCESASSSSETRS